MSDAARGEVVLVGGGPGDPDLITLRGARALREADAVVYDSLAPHALLELAPPGALRIDVGKRSHDAPTRSQEDISALLVRLAREGRRVVRLKGGDPFVLGRGGEEAVACAEAGVPFEVVPGVSSAIGALAYAGIPVTDRRHAASFAVVTGHKDPTRAARETRWDLLGRAVDTLVVLMGLANLEAIVEQLLEGGRSPDTPAAAIMWGTTPSQRVVEAPLRELPARVREAGLATPVAVVVGDVVTLREKLAWFERRPLFGARVLVTRGESQAGSMLEALRRAGALPELLPLLRFAPPVDPAPLDAALGEGDAYDALLFTSRNAVRFTAERARARGVALDARAARVFCVGPATAEAARAAGLPVHGVARRRDAEGLLAELRATLDPAGGRFLLPCAEDARGVLPEGLRAAGARVDVVTAYRNLPTDVDASDLRRRLAAGELDALTFASPSAVRRFCGLLDAASREAAGRCTVAAIGSVTAASLEAEGLPADVVPERPGGPELVEALARHGVRAGGGPR